MDKSVSYKEAEEWTTEQGYSLMHTDSRIALQILEHFTDKGEACLCIHDSFLVVEHLADELREVMDISYRNITKTISPDQGIYYCNISKK